ncbi:LLM class flavin-dependent oxidoreductase [Millisia brevis]|uniref:LLM class flavin-dependent oxidoreductase n=1 Tax=Millisia brevis TaxID=264148 RepID=UPI000831AC66|nr:LLM class flavin-dependent oxidoreductase [Millisia brevis]
MISPQSFGLGWFVDGYSPVHWDSITDSHAANWADPTFYVDFAKSLERACFDFILLEDSSYIPDKHTGTIDPYVRNAVGVPKGDPIPLAARMLSATDHIVIFPTLGTNEWEPEPLARVTAALAEQSGGRSGWNAVTGFDQRAMDNYGKELPSHADRYRNAHTYVQTVGEVWDRRATIRPLTAQAGASEAGRNFAAQHADVIVAYSPTVAGMTEYRDDVRRRMVGHGRDPDDCRVYFIVWPIVASTDEEAHAIKDRVAEHLMQYPDYVLPMLSRQAGIDLSTYDPGTLLKDVAVNANATKGLMESMVRAYGDMTLLEVAVHEGLPVVAGTPATVADQLIDMMAEVGGDGFLFEVDDDLSYANVAAITDGLVPELQRRGVLRSHAVNPLTVER